MPHFTRAGFRNRRVTVQQGVAGSDSEGNATLTWQTLADVWAGINPMGTTEMLLAAQRGEDVTHEVTIAFHPAFAAPGQIRILYGTRIFFVQGTTDPAEAHRQLVLKCKEVVTSQLGAA